jgi:protein-S-isoprenylcysteine O-methyltransferase Ste14
VTPPARAALLAFGAVAYAGFLAVVAVAIDFVGNGGVVRGIDGPPGAPVPAAIAIDVGLLALFGLSHSVMARESFKRRWTKLVPPPAERSAYVLVASLALALIFWQWRALPQPIWEVTAPAARAAIWAVAAGGALLTVVSTFLTSHFDLFGLRQVWLAARGRPYTPVPFRQRAVYAVIRHPMMAGMLIAFWATPVMTWGHALFAAVMSAYIAVGVAFEERDLARRFGDDHRRYRAAVPAVFPLLRPPRR